MEKKINSKALIISLLLALICCFLLFSYIKKLQKPIEEESPKVTVLVASRDIKAGELITQTEINTIDTSSDSIPMGIINNRERIEGLYAKEPILVGESFREERLIQREALSLAWNIPENLRAICVFVNEDAIFSNQIRIGDHVDVIGSFKRDMGGGVTIASSMIIIQNVEVLAIGSDRLEQKYEDVPMEVTDEETSLSRTVTLAVTPEDSEKIVFATDFGEFSLALRGNGNTETTHTKGILVEDVTPSILNSLSQINNQP